tara:strand:+ start:251 stop:943 length:693 start_codon:yes stop_codon:yes gene_type:complete
MASKRFPNKPMALISGKPMIQRVWEKAVSSKIGEVVVACSEKEVQECILSLGGKAILTNPNLPSGTDRIFEAIKKINDGDQFNSIINLQGDMPLINPRDIIKVNKPLSQGFDIGTLVTDITHNQIKDKNITKARVDWIKEKDIGKAKDFFKLSDNNEDNVYHHVGIYSFRYDSLKKFVSLPQSSLEIKLKLEQMRALEAKMTIGVTYVKDVPISVDTKEELKYVEGIINN